MQLREPRDGLPYEACIRVILDEYASWIPLTSRNELRKSRFNYEFDQVFQINGELKSQGILQRIHGAFKYECPV